MRRIQPTVSQKLVCVLALVAVSLHGACGDDAVEPEPVPVATTITIEPQTATLKDARDTVRLTATVLDQNGQAMPDAKVVWSINDTIVALVSAIGLVTAMEPGTAMVEAAVDTLADTAAITVEPGQRAVLHVIYRKMNGDRWTSNTNWKTEEPLDTWLGVDTDSQGNISLLELHTNEVTGSIAPEIGMLGTLSQLIIRGNQVTGSIPPELGNLQNLEKLIIIEDGVTGSIPPELGNLQKLDWLRFELPALTGTIPPELGNLQSLTILYFWGSGLTGSIPPELGNLQSLTRLYLRDGGLTGPIPPEFGNLQSLTTLYLTDNGLTGSIPVELGSLNNLQYLGLSRNSLTGPVPGELGDMSALAGLSIDGNPLSGQLPSNLTKLTLLSWFYWGSTDLCAPTDDGFQKWLDAITDHRGNGDCT